MDDDSFSPETAVAAAVILAIGVFVGLSAGDYLAKEQDAEPAPCEAEARHLRSIVAHALTKYTVITVDGQPAARCYVVRGRQ